MFLLILFIIPVASSFKSDRAHPVHQHITKEALEIWNFTPKEIKDYTSNSLDTSLDFWGTYQPNDDIITEIFK